MGKRILYVEDDEDTRNLVKEILEKEGYEVATACNGKECLSSLEKEKPDLLLLDMMDEIDRRHGRMGSEGD